MLLHELAHARAGDKGSVVTIALVARRPEEFALLEQLVTAERVSRHFSAILDRPVVRYTVPHLYAMNFVLHRSEQFGVTRSLALDAHGKCLASVLLAMEI